MERKNTISEIQNKFEFTKSLILDTIDIAKHLMERPITQVNRTFLEKTDRELRIMLRNLQRDTDENVQKIRENRNNK